MAKISYTSLLSLCLLITSTAPALAKITQGQSDDLFYDRNWVYDRPRVASDYQRSSDMLPKVPLMYNHDADLFDRANRANIYGNEDVLPHVPVPIQRPYYPMTMDPVQGPYLSR